MQTALAELEKCYFTLQSQIDTLSAACQTKDQKDALSTQYVKARQAYWSCVNKAFHDDDPQVASLAAQLDAANAKLKVAVQQMGNISKVIDGITQAVSIAASLSKMVIP